MTDLHIESFKQARWERYCQLAATCALVYEYSITLNDEIQLFWKKRWSFGKMLFLWSRYYSIMFNIGNAIVFLQGAPSFDVSNKFFHWQNTGASLQVVTTHIILELRLWAMYGSSKRLLAFFGLLLACEVTVLGVVFGTPKPGLVGTNNPEPGLFLCADSDPPHVHWITYYWSSILIIESILLSLALWKSYQHHRTGAGGGLMRALTRDSVLYFVFIFWIYLANQIIWIVNDLTLNELATGFSFCVSAILANRLMLTVRAGYYYPRETVTTVGSSTDEADFYIARAHRAFVVPDLLSVASAKPKSWRAASAGAGAPSADIELQSFSERRGF